MLWYVIMSIESISQELSKAEKLKSSFFPATLNRMPFGEASRKWNATCMIELILEAQSGDAPAIETLNSVERQAATVSDDGEMLLLPCGKRLGRCAVILSMNSVAGEPVDCPDHIDRF
jgi:hypothetical protein